MKIIITAGGTSERIDNVRKITNSGTGKLGAIIANTLVERYKEKIDMIYYVCARDSHKPNNNKTKIIEIEGTMELEDSIKKLLKNNKIDYFIHSMAVSDYMVDYISTAPLLAKEIMETKGHNIEECIKRNKNVLNGTKISSNEDNLLIMFKPTPKIISIIKNLSPNTFLIGFKLLDRVTNEELINAALKLLEKNNCDLIVANDLATIKKGNHKAIIIDKIGNKMVVDGKKEIASQLIQIIINNEINKNI